MHKTIEGLAKAYKPECWTGSTGKSGGRRWLSSGRIGVEEKRADGGLPGHVPVLAVFQGVAR